MFVHLYMDMRKFKNKVSQNEWKLKHMSNSKTSYYSLLAETLPTECFDKGQIRSTALRKCNEMNKWWLWGSQSCCNSRSSYPQPTAHVQPHEYLRHNGIIIIRESQIQKQQGFRVWNWTSSSLEFWKQGPLIVKNRDINRLEVSNPHTIKPRKEIRKLVTRG